MSVLDSPSHKDTSGFGLGPTHTTSFYLNYLFRDTAFQWSHVPGSQEWGLQCVSFRETQFTFVKMHLSSDSYKKVSHLPSQACTQAQKLLPVLPVGPHLCPPPGNQAPQTLRGAQGSLHRGDAGQEDGSHQMSWPVWLSFSLPSLLAGRASTGTWENVRSTQ